MAKKRSSKKTRDDQIETLIAFVSIGIYLLTLSILKNICNSKSLFMIFFQNIISFIIAVIFIGIAAFINVYFEYREKKPKKGKKRKAKRKT